MSPSISEVPIRINRRGWTDRSVPGLTLWTSGWFYNPDWPALIRGLIEAKGEVAAVEAILDKVKGHYALIVEGEDWRLGVADRVRSIPVAYVEQDGRLDIHPQAKVLAARYGRAAAAGDGSLALAMAGYTVGSETIFDGVKTLLTGQFILQKGGGPVVCGRHHRYQPWTCNREDDAQLQTDLARVTLDIMRRVAASLDGRVIALPLSAGYDSRLIASALRAIGYDRVVCFSYGLANNYEGQAAKRIAEALGYPWRFFEYAPQSMGRYFQSETFQAYQEFADTGSATPFHQDLPALLHLKDQGYIPDEAVVINGNTGDYISGLHILPKLCRTLVDANPEARLENILSAMVGKHFRLWGELASPERDASIRNQLERRLAEEGLCPSDGVRDFGLFEFLELQGRQSKYVVGGQRVYEFLGHDWVLPLWDEDYFDFWEQVPLSAKAGQRLYRDMLRNEDWGGVWNKSEFWPQRSVKPDWMRLFVRPLCKAAHLPLGQDRWHAFERRYLSYWTENLQGQALHSYDHIRRDRRDPRHMVAWHTEAYLNSHGLDWRGGAV